MAAIREKLAEWSKDKLLLRSLSILSAALLVAIIGLCISILMRSNIQTKYSSLVSQLQEQTYQKLIGMTELFARVDDPNVDVRYKLIPELKAAYSAAESLNAVLRESCGERQAVLTQEQTDAFAAAFEEYAEAYRQGIATGLARADMAACIQEVQAMIDLRYAPPKDEEDEVVVINAESGRIENP